MKKVLYVVYYYPPLGGSGVQRGVKFSKYLPENGWESIILTPSPFWVKHPKDHSLLSDVRPNQKIYRCFTLDAHWLYKVFWGLRLPKVVTWLMFHVFIPDAEILWLPFAKRKLKQVMEIEKPELVFISGPPFSPMLLGKWLRDRYKIPYIVSFRDDWSQGQSRLDNPPPTAFIHQERKLEHSVLKHATQVVVVNRAYKRDFITLYPALPESKFSVITNGYDEEDFAGVKSKSPGNGKILRIVHPGVLFGRRHPGKIWQAIINLVRAGKLDPQKIRVEIYGRNFASFVFRGYEDDPIIRQVVALHPYLPHSQTIELICQADILLLFSGPGAKSDAELPGKLFEYLRAGKPILGIVHPDGVCAEILLKAKSGVVASQEDSKQIESRLLELYEQWNEGTLGIDPDWDYIRLFERRQLTSRLAEVFDKVIERHE